MPADTTTRRFDAIKLHDALVVARFIRMMSWGDLARQTGIDTSTFTRLAHGKVPRVDTLIVLLGWLGHTFETYIERN